MGADSSVDDWRWRGRSRTAERGGSGRLEVEDSTVSEVRLFDQAQAAISKSTVRWAVGIDFATGAKARLDGLSGRHIASWTFPGAEPPVGSTPKAAITNSNVGAWSIGVADGADVTISNSDLDRIVLSLARTPGELHDLRPGAFQNWDLRESVTVDQPIGLHLTQTTVGSWVVNLPGGDYPMKITDCGLVQVGFSDYSGKATIASCDFGVLWLWGGSPTLTFSTTAISRGLELTETFVRLVGELMFAEGAFVATWQKATAIRTFEVVVQDANRAPVPNAKVVVRDARGQKLASQTTDSSGRCAVTVRFSTNPGSSCPTIEVSVSGATATAPVCFLGPTKVIVHVQ